MRGTMPEPAYLKRVFLIHNSLSHSLSFSCGYVFLAAFRVYFSKDFPRGRKFKNVAKLICQAKEL